MFPQILKKTVVESAWKKRQRKIYALKLGCVSDVQEKCLHIRNRRESDQYFKSAWRESFVTQETCLFHDSIAANLRIARWMPHRKNWKQHAKRL